MHKKIMLEFPDGKRRWGYATTEHSASSYGLPVIVQGDIVYGAGDIGDIGVIVNDTETAEKLKKAGYRPISRTHVKKSRGIAFPAELEAIISREAEKKGITFGREVIDALKKFYNKGDENE